MVSRDALVPIPHPRPKPLIGNILELSATSPIQDLLGLARELGPIYQLDMMGKPFTVVSGFDLVDECCDETRFDKSVRGNLRKIREIGGDALFTAYTSEPNWSKAHNILLPNFGDRAMASYHPAMLDIAEQLMLKWSRLNSDDEIDVVHDMTALTLDTIGLTGFGYRFNSLYRRDFHPFVDKMVDSLEIAMAEKGFPFEEVLAKPRQKRMDANAAFMFDLVDRLIAERKDERARTGDDTKRDLLDYMLAGVDKKTGEKLDDTNIRFQIITFLIAGHETTSGMLSFAIYYLLNNPHVLDKAYAEVDRVFGTDVSVAPTLKQVNALQYVSQILKESLRLWPTAPAFAVYPYEDEIVGGKYELKKRSQVVLLLPALHRDAKVWGPRAAVFDPDNFSPEAEAARPLNAYKPFGNGQRACIGRQFALQEAALVVGMMLQRFRLIDHERYVLRVREALTVKPEGFKIKVRERVHKHVAVASLAANGATNGSASPAATTAAVPSHGTPLLVLFGSNLGTAEDVAHQLADAGTSQGFAASVGWLDDFVDQLPTDGAVAIVTASYNGAPPDNAAGFVKWLQDERAGSLAGVKYAVFGCGNRNWASTYQSVPRLIDERLAAHGAQRLFARGEGDARDDLDADFRTWRAAYLPALARAFDVAFDGAAQTAEKPQYAVRVVESPEPNPLAALHGATQMRVARNRELQSPGSPRSTRHLDIELPAGTTYRAGDHLGIVAPNPSSVVARALARFDFGEHTYVVLDPTGPRTSSLPAGKAIALRHLLGEYVELQHVATRTQLQTLAAHTRCPKTRPQLLALASDGDDDATTYKAEVKAKRRSVLDILENHPACEVPFETYLDMLPVMTPRYYSIASSPLAQPDRCSITVGVVTGAAFSGNGSFEGVCSTHLRRTDDGEQVHAFVKQSKSGFALPDDPERPIVMVGPGTGLAPFRGFLQERAALAAGGATLGPAMLFFGCRNANEDYIYRDELEAFAAAGHVELHVAFSRAGAEKRYVQHDIAERGDAVWALLEAGANVYVCGDGSRMEPDVRAALTALHARATGGNADASAAWISGLMTQGRYNLDVWAND